MKATTMPVGTLICDLVDKGIKLRVESGGLRIDAPKGRVTPYVLRVLKDRKPEIIRELKGEDGEFQFGKTASLYRDAKLPNRIHLNEAILLYRKRGWIQIYSTYLESNIYLVRDDAVRVPDPSIPQYTQAEIQSLKDLTLDELKTLHEVKVIFKGKIIS
jgi:hypothetical protein